MIIITLNSNSFSDRQFIAAAASAIPCVPLQCVRARVRSGRPPSPASQPASPCGRNPALRVRIIVIASAPKLAALPANAGYFATGHSLTRALRVCLPACTIYVSSRSLRLGPGERTSDGRVFGLLRTSSRRPHFEFKRHESSPAASIMEHTSARARPSEPSHRWAFPDVRVMRGWAERTRCSKSRHRDTQSQYAATGVRSFKREISFCFPIA